jgi:hypothetical protein
MSDNDPMITLIAIAVPLAVWGAVDVLALKFGAESRPGFDERRPLS